MKRPAAITTLILIMLPVALYMFGVLFAVIGMGEAPGSFGYQVSIWLFALVAAILAWFNYREGLLLYAAALIFSYFERWFVPADLAPQQAASTDWVSVLLLVLFEIAIVGSAIRYWNEMKSFTTKGRPNA